MPKKGEGMKLIDLAGSKFSRWLVLNRAPNDNRGRTHWHCVCDCGVERIVAGTHLRGGNSKSCGCYHIEKITKHGYCSTANMGGSSPVYRSWIGAKSRCSNPKHANYKDYGGRGITMCEEWRKDFSAFYRDMGPRPEGCSLHRVNNDGNYEPGNCRWATPKEQSQNTRWKLSQDALFAARRLLANTRLSQAQIATRTGMSPKTVSRIHRREGIYA